MHAPVAAFEERPQMINRFVDMGEPGLPVAAAKQAPNGRLPPAQGNSLNTNGAARFAPGRVRWRWQRGRRQMDR